MVRKCENSKKPSLERKVSTQAGDWRNHKLIFTKHARCRMECREITEAEVEAIVLNGVINEAKSKEEDEEASGQCPTYALEGTTDDGQSVRIVVGACEKITKVITAIDLKEEHTCDCR